MTTSRQPTPLTVEELEALRRAASEAAALTPARRDALLAKGMLQDDGAGLKLTPAGRHALDIGDGPAVPGLDN